MTDSVCTDEPPDYSFPLFVFSLILSFWHPIGPAKSGYSSFTCP